MEQKSTIAKPPRSKKPNLELYKMGKFIHQQRADQKLSLAQLSEKAFGNTHYASKISLIERGEYPNATFMIIVKLLNVLGHRII